jgi:hypothetical protein
MFDGVRKYPFVQHGENDAWTWDVDLGGTVWSPKCKARNHELESVYYMAEEDDDTEASAMVIETPPPSCKDCDVLDEMMQMTSADVGKRFGKESWEFLLRKALENAEDQGRHKGTTNNEFLTWEQMQRRHTFHRKQRGEQRMANLNAERDLGRMRRSRDSAQALIESLATDNPMRATQLLAQGLARGESSDAIARRVQRAVDGLYHPKKFGSRDLKEAIVVLRLGGPRMLYMLHVERGLPSGAHLYTNKLVQLATFRIAPMMMKSVEDLAYAFMVDNFESFFFCNPHKGKRRLHDFLIDDVAIDPSLRVHPSVGNIVGLCEHFEHVVWATVPAMRGVKEKLDACEGHRASVATVMAIGKNARLGNAIVPVHCAGSCKHMLAVGYELLFGCALHLWYSDPRGYAMRGPLCSFQSDGDATFRKAGSDLCSGIFSEPFLVLLKPLLGFDLSAGLHDVISVCDMKHDVKRFRTRLRAFEGTLIRHHAFTEFLVKEFLRHAGVDASDIETIFVHGDEHDGMSVPAAVLTMKKYALIGTLSFAALNFPPLQAAARQSQYREFLILAAMCKCFEDLLTGQHLNIGEHLVNISKLGHLFFVVFRASKTKFVAAQNYSNTQSIVKGLFKAIAQCQIENINEFYVFLFSDDRLEQLFGTARTLVGAMRNFDMLQLGERLAAAAQLEAIFEEYPQWRRLSRHLVAIDDKANTRSWDHAGVNRHTYPGADFVDIKGCWEQGAAAAASVLTRHNIFSAAEVDWTAIFATDGVDMLRPLGALVGVSEAHP